MPEHQAGECNDMKADDAHPNKDLWEPGEEAFFEYHCNRSYESDDANL